MHILLITIIFASLNSVLLHNVKFKSDASVYKFNTVCSFVWLAILFSLNGFRLQFGREALIFGLVYGVTQALFVFFKTMAMNSGPVSVTTLIGNASLLISVFVSYFLWGEEISALDVLGLCILLFALFLTTYKNEYGAKSKRWYVLSFFFLVFAAGVGISFKAYSKTAVDSTINEMMTVAAAVMLVLYISLYALYGVVLKKTKQSEKEEGDGWKFILYAIGAGILSCVYNRLNIWLSGVLDAVIFFPIFNGGVVLLSALLASLFFKERLQKKQVAGLVLGVLAICIIGIF